MIFPKKSAPPPPLPPAPSPPPLLQGGTTPPRVFGRFKCARLHLYKNHETCYNLGYFEGFQRTEPDRSELQDSPPPPAPSLNPPPPPPAPHLNLRYYDISHTCEDSSGGTGVVRKIHSGVRGPYGGPQIGNGFGEDRISSLSPFLYCAPRGLGLVTLSVRSAIYHDCPGYSFTSIGSALCVRTF